MTTKLNASVLHSSERLLSIYIDGEIEGIDVNECLDILVNWDEPEDFERCVKIAKAIARLFESAGGDPTTDSESDLGDPNVPSRHELRMWEHMGGDQ